MKTSRVTTLTASPRWYVVQCKPRQNERAMEQLGCQGFHCYCPKLTVERLRGGSKLTVEEPLFPRYLFIQLDNLNDNWYPIRSTRGVSHILTFDGYPVPVVSRFTSTWTKRLS